jgi:hypothetical protein
VTGRGYRRRGNLDAANRFVSLVVQDDIIAAIIQWPESHSGCHLQALVHHISARLNAPIGSNSVLGAIEVLRDQQLIESDGPIYRIREPDRREHDLYDLLESEFMKPTLRQELGLRTEHFVFQRTATGGPVGSGLLSKPDFTLAAIQSWRFDPERTLEVYSFEVKNRSGTALKAVYEAVAHGRFAHHPYLVCPRSRFNAAFNAEIETACVREGVGLIMFDLIAENGSHTVNRLGLVVRGQRRSPDPWLVQQHLESRLVSENQDRLASFAAGVP